MTSDTRPALRVLTVECEGAAVPELPASSPFGPFDFQRVSGLAAAAERLGAESFDAVLIAARTADARQLPTWAALSQAAVDPALVVLTTDDPGADLALLLMRHGVQDLHPLAIDPVDALPRALRLGIERKAQERLMRKAYATDVMTGLRSQAQLVEHADQLMALREREPAPMAMLALRVEGLAALEMRSGRETANVLRRKIAVRLRVGVRASDVVASISVDVFAVLLSKVRDSQDAEAVAAKLAAALRPPFSVTGRDVALAVAVGVAHHPQDGKTAAALLRRAVGLAVSAQAVGRAGLTQGAAAGVAANDATAGQGLSPSGS